MYTIGDGTQREMAIITWALFEYISGSLKCFFQSLFAFVVDRAYAKLSLDWDYKEGGGWEWYFEWYNTPGLSRWQLLWAGKQSPLYCSTVCFAVAYFIIRCFTFIWRTRHSAGWSMFHINSINFHSRTGISLRTAFNWWKAYSLWNGPFDSMLRWTHCIGIREREANLQPLVWQFCKLLSLPFFFRLSPEMNLHSLGYLKLIHLSNNNASTSPDISASIISFQSMCSYCKSTHSCFLSCACISSLASSRSITRPFLGGKARDLSCASIFGVQLLECVFFT